jgi:ATP-binding cassette subfamily B protein
MDYKQEKEMAGILRIYQFVYKFTSCIIVFAAVYMYSIGMIDIYFGAMYIVSSFFIYSELENMGDTVFLARRINNQLDILEKIMDMPMLQSGKSDIEKSTYDIEFENVCFSYDKRDVLKNINLKLGDNETMAVVGPSGSGKTTLCMLLGRFWDVKSGRIKIGKKDIRDIDYDALMKKISMVFQDVYLFNDTIENNVKFGNKNATREEVITACKRACCHEFISSLPCGYDTVIGEGGSTLSGGEKQRISISRAIIKDSPIIIFDEMTSSVDPENEHLLVEAMNNLTQNKTVITISHKISTIKNADKIIVINEGPLFRKENMKY